MLSGPQSRKELMQVPALPQLLLKGFSSSPYSYVISNPFFPQREFQRNIVVEWASSQEELKRKGEAWNHEEQNKDWFQVEIRVDTKANEFPGRTWANSLHPVSHDVQTEKCLPSAPIKANRELNLTNKIRPVNSWKKTALSPWRQNKLCTASLTSNTLWLKHF